MGSVQLSNEQMEAGQTAMTTKIAYPFPHPHTSGRGAPHNFSSLFGVSMSYAYKRRKKLIKRGKWKFKPQQKGN
tara:strand:- start:456 stop:677 length:222 start_codon:yes stop_codon:yes gene_type:complete